MKVRYDYKDWFTIHDAPGSEGICRIHPDGVTSDWFGGPYLQDTLKRTNRASLVQLRERAMNKPGTWVELEQPSSRPKLTTAAQHRVGVLLEEIQVEERRFSGGENQFED